MKKNLSSHKSGINTDCSYPLCETAKKGAKCERWYHAIGLKRRKTNEARPVVSDDYTNKWSWPILSQLFDEDKN